MAVELKTIRGKRPGLARPEHVGSTVVVEEIESGVWLVKTAQVIPDNQLWLPSPQAKQHVKGKRSETDLSGLARKVKRLR